MKTNGKLLISELGLQQSIFGQTLSSRGEVDLSIFLNAWGCIESRRLSWGRKESLLFRGFSGEINSQLWRNSSYFLRFLSSYEQTNKQNSNVSKGDCKMIIPWSREIFSFEIVSTHMPVLGHWICLLLYVSFRLARIMSEYFLADSLLYLKNKRNFCQ